jgi:predicted AlkP superfamily phosphohydrolase/phosphomutase
MDFKDPQTDQPVFAKIYRSADIYHGPHVSQAPDLLTGFHRGYRTSWETALGGVPREMIVDNKDKWSGDHCMAAELVPGVILSSKPILMPSPALHDLAPTILHEFGLQKGEQMIGSSIFETATAASRD